MEEEGVKTSMIFYYYSHIFVYAWITKKSYITRQYGKFPLAHTHGENRSHAFANSARLLRFIVAKGHSRKKILQ